MAESTQYRLRIRETLAPHWADYLAGLEITHEADGSTTLSGPLPDQAALHGVLAVVRDLGLTLLAVTRVDDAPIG